MTVVFYLKGLSDKFATKPVIRLHDLDGQLWYNETKKLVTIMSSLESNFNELLFFAQIQKRPGIFIEKPSILSLRDHLFGMDYAFSFCCRESPLKYFHSFVTWYHEEIIKDLKGYACWWNHILYTNGNHDAYAFEAFFIKFEKYLLDVHHVSLPDVT